MTTQASGKELATLERYTPTVADNMRQATDVAGVCREIVVACAKVIQGRKFVGVEGWQAIAIAHGCVASARDVERVETGYRAIGEIRRQSDGFVICTAEGFVGVDEPTWFGGESEKWEKGKWITKTLPTRAEYACRAMAQTRAISRACRSAFAHVVVMMNAGLETTPAEEMPPEEPATVHREATAHQEAQAPAHKGPQHAPQSPAKPKHPEDDSEAFTDWRGALTNCQTQLRIANSAIYARNKTGVDGGRCTMPRGIMSLTSPDACKRQNGTNTDYLFGMIPLPSLSNG